MVRRPRRFASAIARTVSAVYRWMDIATNDVARRQIAQVVDEHAGGRGELAHLRAGPCAAGRPADTRRRSTCAARSRVRCSASVSTSTAARQVAWSSLANVRAMFCWSCSTTAPSSSSVSVELGGLLEPPDQLRLLGQLLPAQPHQRRVAGQAERRREPDQRRLVHLGDLGGLTDTAERGRLRIGEQHPGDPPLACGERGHPGL